MYVYIQSEKPGWSPHRNDPNRVWLTGSLWTVGFYSPDGKWNPESDHESPEKAAERVHYLNGGAESENPYIMHGEELKRAIGKRIKGY